jgi:hypothetical protein
MIEQLKELIKQVCKGEATVEQEKFIVASYQKIYGKPFSNCRCQLCDAIFQMLKTIETMNSQTFKLKKGIALNRFGQPEIYTAETITDEAAIAHLRERPQDVHLFDVIPDSYYKQPRKLADMLPKEEIITPEIPKVTPTVKTKRRRK